ncbi:MAG TPA: aspartate/glutamate racemase family protein [Thermoanaerobaculia bacterium]|nr:aspartate/glutamate racemase family protein [Thermoanaerobaculia bacterium]
MKTIGLLGGMSWESSIEYYRLLNELVRERLGGLHSARCVMTSVDFAPLAERMHEGRWDEIAAILADDAKSAERAGADLLILCTNTMHKVADAVEAAVTIPFLHIVDPTGEAIAARGFRTVGLLGTRFTMEEPFYAGRLSERFGLTVLVPEADDRELVHRVVFEELCLGVVKASSRKGYADVIARLAHRGAEAVILGCTEIGLLVEDEDSPVPLFDTTRLHAAAAVDLSLAPAGAAREPYARERLGLAT